VGHDRIRNKGSGRNGVPSQTPEEHAPLKGCQSAHRKETEGSKRGEKGDRRGINNIDAISKVEEE
jgi:hypothetical protein